MYEGIDTIFLVHHSHTDIGYTHDQPIVWDLHRRFIELAIDECEKHADRDAADAFRWTVETTLVLLDWLRTASDTRVEQFLRLVRAGRIEVTAMPVNITPLFDTEELVEGLEPVRRLRKQYGIPIRHAMNSDVNGENWPLVDALLDAGIEGFSMATNIHFGGSPLAWPNAFHWQGPSGRSILAWNGWDYAYAYEAGIDCNAAGFRDEGWPRIDSWLREREYPLPVLMMQLFDAFGDNGPTSPTISRFVREWNEKVGRPRLRIAVPADWWSAVAKHAAVLPTYRGDWTDFWNFGCASSAREVAINRASRSRLRAADAAAGVIGALGGEDEPARVPGGEAREQAGRAMYLWDEHTWGADRSVFSADDEDTAAQWNHKASFAYTARSLSLMLQRDAVAELARRVARAPGDACLIFNPLPVPRTVSGPVVDSFGRGTRGRGEDPTSARHSVDRGRVSTTKDLTAIEPIGVPAFGYALVPESATKTVTIEAVHDPIVETSRYVIEFDIQRGGIRRWLDKRLGKELVDGDTTWPLNGWVHEEPLERGLENPRRALWAPVERRLGLERGWRSGWPAERVGPRRVLGHDVYRRADGLQVEQRLELPSGAELIQTTLIPAGAEWIECESAWHMGLDTKPEATYIAFPFLLPHAAARVDLGGQAMRVDADQLPRACRDYYTTQGWVDLSNDELGVTVACLDAPMVQLGDFSFGANRTAIRLERALLLGWVTNNYWETNFRAHQPGEVRARYRLLPHGAPFDEAAAHAFGLDAMQPVVYHPLAEPAAAGALLPREGTLLQLPRDPVLTLRVWSEDGQLLVRMLNASDRGVDAEVGSGVLQISGAARCDLFGDGAQALPVSDGAVRIALGPRQIATLRLSVVVGMVL